ncbi:MAG: hypothetical protein IJT59_04765 [Desulfovibrionaceae bacterium]|nr:hypothetical protein [Desulfovibrionaceae bacterium]
MTSPFFVSAQTLSQTDPKDWPKDLISSQNLIYSSKATLAFNSPGAEGFGVKRAALTMPESVLLLFSPGCCGRNTSAIGGPTSQYGQRTYYLLLDETDIVTGRYLPKIVEAASEIMAMAKPKPKVIMLCSTCVDALLGTDMEQLCRKVEEKCSCHALAATMYALTREGHLPPMVAVRRTLYSLLKKQPKDPRAANILGFFTGLDKNCELYELLACGGIDRVYELGCMDNLKAYHKMSSANFNLVLHSEARLAADDMEKNFQIPAIELFRTYQLSKITNQYKILGQILGLKFKLQGYEGEGNVLTEKFSQDFKGINVALGEGVNADPLDLALTLLRLGLNVPEIFAAPAPTQLPQLKAIADLSPDTKIYSNLHPSMMFYEDNLAQNIDITIGLAANYYHQECKNLLFNSDEQPFGYQGLKKLLSGLRNTLAPKRNSRGKG